MGQEVRQPWRMGRSRRLRGTGLLASPNLHKVSEQQAQPQAAVIPEFCGT